METERTLASEFVNRLFFQISSASAPAETGVVNAAQQFDGTILTTKIGQTEPLIIGHTIREIGALLARLLTVTFVDFQLAITSLEARKSTI
jgi:hypothetical protein